MWNVYVQNGALQRLVKTYEDDIIEEFKRNRTCMDKYLFLISLFHILEDCTYQLYEKKKYLNRDFWKLNELLLNYVNAIYTFKSYIENCYGKNSKENKIQNRYFLSNEWYSFICDYRNKVIHQGSLIKVYDYNSGELYIDLDEIIDFTKESKLNNKCKNNLEKKINRAEEHIKFIKDLFPLTIIDCEEKHHCLSLKKILEEVHNEICSMANEIFDCIYEDRVRESFIWVIKHIEASDNERYGLTYFVHEDTDKQYEINHYIEYYICEIMFTLEKNNIVTQKILKLLKDSAYFHIYSNDCSLQDLETVLDNPTNYA